MTLSLAEITYDRVRQQAQSVTLSRLETVNADDLKPAEASSMQVYLEPRRSSRFRGISPEGEGLNSLFFLGKV